MAKKIKSGLTRIGGYLIPLVQQIPPLGIYAGLMTLPVLTNILLLFTNLDLTNIWQQIIPPFNQEWATVGIIVFLVGVALALISIVYLVWKKRDGLVTTGPYRYIRHPQYTGFLLLTCALSAYSYWILAHTFGVGWQLWWLTDKQTVVFLWYAQVGAYILLALIEESYMSKEFGDEYLQYKNNSSSFIPFGKITKKFDILFSVGILSVILFILLIPSLPL
ncbi:MAG: methyltransferase family protein [Candidatus Ranarchaeia archaeon]|jgi:protein-S-isoprenylcysteine O-methyltransferase Ste14